MAEHIGDHTALSTIIGKDLLKNPGLDRTLLGDGIATFVAGILGGPANTTYGENTSGVGMTKIASVWVIGLAAIIAICLGFLGKFTAIISTIPEPVLGGVSLLPNFKSWNRIARWTFTSYTKCEDRSYWTI